MLWTFQGMVQDNCVGNISFDPRFADADNGDFHLLWNSLLINSGRPDNWQDPDGSPADIARLWPFANGEGELRDREDYCVIPPNAQLSNNGEDFGLEYDTYWMFGDATVEPDEALTIEAGATVVMFPNAAITVTNATFLVQGVGFDFGEVVTFRPKDNSQPMPTMESISTEARGTKFNFGNLGLWNLTGFISRSARSNF